MKDMRTLHVLEGLQNYECLFVPKQGAYLCLSGPVNETSTSKEKCPFLLEFGKSSLWSHKVALKYIWKYRVGRFALDQEADLCPKGTEPSSSCYGTTSIFVY